MRPVTKIALLSIAVIACFAGIGSSAFAKPHEKTYLTIFTAANPSPEGMSLISWFEGGTQTDYRLTQLRQNASWNHYTERDPLYQQRFAKYFSPREFPVICFQRHDGAVLYKSSAQNLPANASQMADEIDYYATLQPHGPKDALLNDSADHYGRLTRADKLVVTNTAGQCVDGSCFPNLRPDRNPGPENTPLWDSKDLLDFNVPPLFQVDENARLVAMAVAAILAGLLYRRLQAEDDEAD
jgi:hypothetical protein